MIKCNHSTVKEMITKPLLVNLVLAKRYKVMLLNQYRTLA